MAQFQLPRCESMPRFLLAACCMFFAADEAMANITILDTDGFENYTIDQMLQGQQGWLTAGHGGGTATVTDDLVESGSKAVRVDRGANSDDRWAVSFSGANLPVNRYVAIDWDMYVEGTGAAAGVFGPFLGVDAYDDTNGPNVLGSLGVDATTGEILYQEQGSGILLATSAVGFDVWNHFQIRLDFLLDQYTISVNGAELATEGFVDTTTDTFTDADIAAFAAAFNQASQSQTATAHFDNFAIIELPPGDFDLDGDVDGVDLGIWEASAGINDGGDADYDGDTDGYDFLIWQRNHGCGVEAGPPLAAAIPEPATATLAVLASLLVGRRRRR